MEIIKKLREKSLNLGSVPTITMAFLGDSVTQGCFELIEVAPNYYSTVFDQNATYHGYLKQILSLLIPQAPINIINAGISGDTSLGGAHRVERDVLRFDPDLVVVCYGLNDVGTGPDKVGDYVKNLSEIFDKLQQHRCEVIFMTPNMMNTSVSVRIDNPAFAEIAREKMVMMERGDMDLYMDAARALCAERNIPVCDCYAKWKKMAENGIDVTELLANKINHPTREMNWLFAVSLLETMLQ